jgi:hypothetical protein
VSELHPEAVGYRGAIAFEDDVELQAGYGVLAVER